MRAPAGRTIAVTHPSPSPRPARGAKAARAPSQSPRLRGRRYAQRPPARPARTRPPASFHPRCRAVGHGSATVARLSRAAAATTRGAADLERLSRLERHAADNNALIFPRSVRAPALRAWNDRRPRAWPDTAAARAHASAPVAGPASSSESARRRPPPRPPRAPPRAPRAPPGRHASRDHGSARARRDAPVTGGAPDAFFAMRDQYAAFSSSLNVENETTAPLTSICARPPGVCTPAAARTAPRHAAPSPPAAH